MRLFKLALPCLFVAGLALFAARSFTDHADRAARSLAVEHARLQFAERAALVRQSPDADHYRGELRALLRDWFGGQMALGNRFPALRGQPAPYVPAPPKARGDGLREWQELADARVSQWREDKLELLETAESAGLRLDLLRVARAGTQLAVDVAVWGAPEETEVEELAPGREQRRMTVPLVFRGLALRFFDAAGAMVARMEVAGEPALRLDVPERLVTDAPPGVVLARYEPAPFPPGAAEVEWTLSVQVRTASGETRPAQAVWRRKVDPAWTGAAWSADDKVVAEAAVKEPAARPAVARASASTAQNVVWPARE